MFTNAITVLLQNRDMRTTNGIEVAVNGSEAEEMAASSTAVARAVAANAVPPPKSGFAKAAGVVARSAIQINMGELLAPLSQLGGKGKERSIVNERKPLCGLTL